jgi:hypothetical protein
MSLQYITKDILIRNGSGEALLELPYDIGFYAGYDKDMVAEAPENATYGHLVMARSGTFIGCVGSLDSSGTLQILIEKNGTNIYQSNPAFSSSTTLTDGTLLTNNFVSGDRITFKITSYSSGSGVRVTLKCNV